MDPRRLELLARRVPDEAHARRLFDYLDSLDARQRAGLAGTRDRLAILAESELGRWLDPGRGRAGARPAARRCARAPSCTSASRPTACRCSRGCSRRRSSATC